MSEQAERLERWARDSGVIHDPPEDGRGAGNDGPTGQLPRLQLPGAGVELRTFARRLGEVLKGKEVYRRDRVLVRANHRALRMDPVTPHAMRTIAEEWVAFFTERQTIQGVFQLASSMTLDVATAVLQAPVFLDQIPEVSRINPVRQPVFRGNGRLALLPEGYDAESCTFTFRSGIGYDEGIKFHDAVRYLDDLLGEFPFADVCSQTGQSRSKSVTIAGMLSMFAGGLLPARALRPVLVYTSNSQRSGKSLLAKMALLPLFGTFAPQAWSENKEEMRKTLDSEVLSASPYIIFDNLKGHVNNATLEAFLTAPSWKGRVLGCNQMFQADNIASVFLTGNQLSVSTDIAGRSLWVELWVDQADPQERRVQREIDEQWLADPKNRRDILSALWAIVKEWDARGRPRGEGGLVGYGAWCGLIGGIAREVGWGDPLHAPKLDLAGDNQLEDMTELAVLLLGEAQTSEYTFAEIVEIARGHNLFDWIIPDEDELKPREKSMLGKMLRSYEGRIFHRGDVHVRFGQRGRKRTRRYSVTRL